MAVIWEQYCPLRGHLEIHEGVFAENGLIEVASVGLCSFVDRIPEMFLV